LPTYSPWLNPIEMLWRQFRREVTHCELFDSIEALLDATWNFFDCYNRKPGDVLHHRRSSHMSFDHVLRGWREDVLLAGYGG
jgi:putative transposase